MSMTRREMLAATVTSAGAGAALAAAGCASLTPANADTKQGAGSKPMIDQLPDNATILLQGDSITDAGRSRAAQDTANDFAMLGNGYAKLIAYHLLSRYPDKGLSIYNRGISGHKVPDLDARWDRDAIDLQPDLVSILIGVNDIWHKLNGNYDGTAEQYGEQLAALLARTKDALPDAKLVVCEPFVLRCGAVNDGWFPEFDERRALCKQAADQAGAVFVPFQSMFDHAVAAGSEPNVWAGDGVHPSGQGAALMAMRWMSETGL
ncbi:MAG: SGNH/GDSL hydrolase family protein [Phycisphaerales bacterium JB063]